MKKVLCQIQKVIVDDGIIDSSGELPCQRGRLLHREAKAPSHQGLVGSLRPLLQGKINCQSRILPIHLEKNQPVLT